MCWEQSRLKRTIATSRSDDNRDEPETETTRRTQDLARATNLKNPRLRPALPLRSHLEENRFRLTNSFRNGVRQQAPHEVLVAPRSGYDLTPHQLLGNLRDHGTPPPGQATEKNVTLRGSVRVG